MTAEQPRLTENHRNTLYHLERHPTSHNLEWPDVLALLREVGTVTEEHNGKVKFRLGDEVLVLSPPRHKDIDEDMVLRLRRILRDGGYFTAEK
jgi:hypothetical protein